MVGFEGGYAGDKEISWGKAQFYLRKALMVLALVWMWLEYVPQSSCVRSLVPSVMMFRGSGTLNTATQCEVIGSLGV